MMLTKIFAPLGLLALLLLGLFQSNLQMQQVEPSAQHKQTQGTFAVMELFTSEGCSSCPAADRSLSRLMSQAQRRGWRVMALAYHVDYWNRLGWKDVFSQRRFSLRQWEYAKKFGTERHYTPQLVINGRHQMVGSNESRAMGTLRREINRPTTAQSQLSAQFDPEDQRYHVRFQLKHIPANSRIHLLLTERGLVSRVRQGENAGRSLIHNYVVREIRSFTVGSHLHGYTSIPLPKGALSQNMTLVMLVQNPKTKQILHAAKLRVGRPIQANIARSFSKKNAIYEG